MSFQPSVTSELLELLVLHFKHLLMDSAATHSPLILSNYTPHHSHHIWAAKVKKLTLPVLQNFKERRKPYVLPDSAPALSTSDFSHNMHLKQTQFLLPPNRLSWKNLLLLTPPIRMREYTLNADVLSSYSASSSVSWSFAAVIMQDIILLTRAFLALHCVDINIY